MAKILKVRLSDPGVKQIVKTAFPDYRGRKVTVALTERPVDVRSYWDGGTRSDFVVVDLQEMRTLGVPTNGQNLGPSTMAVAPNGVAVPVGFAIIEHAVFCGQDGGITIHVHPATVTPFISAKA